MKGVSLSLVAVLMGIGLGCGGGSVGSGDDGSVDPAGSGGSAGEGGISGSGGVSGTGGGTPATCTGTPSSTCSSATCDQVPGCTITTPPCTGTASPCSTYDGKTACASQLGCFYNINGGKCYVAHACPDADSDYNLCKNFGCAYSPSSGYCTGQGTACESITFFPSCAASARCKWQTGAVTYCTGVAMTCESLPRSACTKQAGCTLTSPACTGEPTPCAQLSATACSTQPGCVLTGAGGAGGATGSGGYKGAGGSTMPDLIVSSFTVTEAVVSGADTFKITILEINRGNYNAVAHKDKLVVSKDNIIGNADDVMFLEYDVPFTVDPFGLLTAREVTPNVKKTDIAAMVPAGYYYIGVVLDSDSQVTESEETNNTQVGTKKYFIGIPAYDIKVSSVSWDATSPIQVGTATNVSVTVENAGNYPIASYTVQVLLSADTAVDASDVALCSKAVATTIEPGAQTVVQLSCSTPRLRGSYHLAAKASLASSITDVDPTNNSLVNADTSDFTAPSPDLTASSVSANPWSAAYAGTVTFSASVTNAGVDPAGAFNVGFYLSGNSTYDPGDLLLCQTLVGSLAAGASTSVSKGCQLPTGEWGPYKIVAVADNTDLVFETTETNNAAASTGSLTIATPTWDLELDAFTEDAIFTITVGQMVNFKVYVTNYGTDAIAAYDIEVRMSTDANYSSSDDLVCTITAPAIAAQSKMMVTFGCEIPSVYAGNYYFGVALDPADDVEETDETNNMYLDNTSVHPLK